MRDDWQVVPTSYAFFGGRHAQSFQSLFILISFRNSDWRVIRLMDVGKMLIGAIFFVRMVLREIDKLFFCSIVHIYLLPSIYSYSHGLFPSRTHDSFTFEHIAVFCTSLRFFQVLSRPVGILLYNALRRGSRFRLQDRLSSLICVFPSTKTCFLPFSRSKSLRSDHIDAVPHSTMVWVRKLYCLFLRKLNTSNLLRWKLVLSCEISCRLRRAT